MLEASRRTAEGEDQKKFLEIHNIGIKKKKQTNKQSFRN